MTTTTSSTTAATATKDGVDDDPNGVYDETDLGHAGYGPFRYRLLAEPHLTRELARQALSKSYQLGEGGASSSSSSGAEVPVSASRRTAYSVSFQPCCNPEALSQDRLSVESWAINGGSWTFAAVFDGHGGHDTADYTLQTLPSEIRAVLSAHLSTSSSSDPQQSQINIDPEAISKLLASTITAFDERIGQALLALFPGGEQQVANMSDDEIKQLVNDQDSGSGTNAAILARCMRGSTALITLVDPAREHLWIANLGDCVAVLGEIDGDSQSTAPAQSVVLNSLHNGSNRAELDRVEREHPGEPECTLRKRVLGALAVTRALGDHTFKLPNIYTERVFFNARAAFKTMTPMHEVLRRIRTPPYVSNTPEVNHVALVQDSSSSASSNSKSKSNKVKKATFSAAEVDAVRRVIEKGNDSEPALADGDVPPPPTPLRDDEDGGGESEPGAESVLVQSEGGIGLEVVPPTPKVSDARPSYLDNDSDGDDDDGGEDTEGEEEAADAGFRHAVSEELSRNTEYGSMVGDDAASASLISTKAAGVQKDSISKNAKRRFLILASDGLQYLYDDVVVADRWTGVVGRTLAGVGIQEVDDEMKNPALALLRDALGGEDAKRVSSMLTVELEERWMDDTTIVVLPL